MGSSGRTAALLAGLLLFAVILLSRASDVDILLEFAQSAGGSQLTGWNSSNAINLCGPSFQWQGITCHSDGTVSEIRLTAERNAPILRGTIPPSLALLANMTVLQLEHNLLVGDFPANILALPKIKVVTIGNTGLTLKFPAQISPTLEILGATGLNYNGTLPDMDWPVTLNLATTGLTCPLPPSLINFLNSGKDLEYCRLWGTRIWVDSNHLVCGQIPIERMSCQIYPSQFVPEYFPEDIRPAQVDYRVERENITLEFIRDKVYIFARYNTSRQERKEYRREYIIFKAFPIGEGWDNGGQEFFRSHPMPGFTSFIETAESIRANITMLGGQFDMEYIFYFNHPLAAPGSLKLSIYNYNHGYKWLNQSRDAFFGFSVGVRQAHSPVQGDLIKCNDGLIQICDSSVIHSETTIRSALNGELTYDFLIESLRTRVAFSFAMVASADGKDIASEAGVDGSLIFSSLGFLGWVIKALWNPLFTPAVNIPVGQENDQYLVIPVQLSTNKYNYTMFYDPDVSITLLFNPDQSAPDAGEAAAVFGAGAIAAVIVVPIVIILGIVVFAKWVFPFLARRNAAAPLVDAEPLPEVPSSDASNRRSTWVSGATPSAAINNNHH